jgi:hypothetical protein
MKNLKILIVAIILTGAIPATLSAQRETRDLKNFTEIGFSVPGDLYVKTGNDFSIILEGDADLLSKVETEIKGNRLIIKHENFRWNWDQKIKAYVTMPSVEGLSISGSGNIYVENPIKGSSLGLSISGSGKVYAGAITYENLKCSISGSGDFIFEGSGSVASAELSISGSGSYKAPDLKVDKLQARISGSGSCDCFVSESLTASISGSGNINYSGRPSIDVRSSGSGKVRSK